MTLWPNNKVESPVHQESRHQGEPKVTLFFGISMHEKCEYMQVCLCMQSPSTQMNLHSSSIFSLLCQCTLQMLSIFFFYVMIIMFLSKNVLYICQLFVRRSMIFNILEQCNSKISLSDVGFVMFSVSLSSSHNWVSYFPSLQT